MALNDAASARLRMAGALHTNSWKFFLQKLSKYRLEILDFAAAANTLGKIWR
jgi:hypothetical protein